jgi:hypothetical protein
MRSVSATDEEAQSPAQLTETIVDKLNNPATSSDFDFHEGVNRVLADVGMSAADSGGQLTFYGQDPIVPSRIRFATMAGIGLAAKTITASVAIMFVSLSVWAREGCVAGRQHSRSAIFIQWTHCCHHR